MSFVSRKVLSQNLYLIVTARNQMNGIFKPGNANRKFCCSMQVSWYVSEKCFFTLCSNVFRLAVFSILFWWFITFKGNEVGKTILSHVCFKESNL